ncbi:MAG TPA: hypothetical protein VGK73_24760 [Polyangiaceae bacterium]
MIETHWLAREPRFRSLPRQAFDLLRRGVRRPLALLFGSFLLTLGLAAAIGMARSGYAPRLVLRVVEADREASTMPELKRKLGEYVKTGVFASDPLFEIIKRHGLYPKLAARDRTAAIEEFRHDIQVEVYQNYFVEQRTENGQPRSARVALSYHGKDRLTAVAVTRELGALVIARETALRRDQTARAAAAADLAEEALRTALSDRVQAAARKQAELEASDEPNPATQVEFVSLLGSIAAVERQADAAGKRAAALELGARYEQRGMGLSIEVADDAGVGISSRAVRARQAAAVVAYLFALPMMVMAVGAFAPKRGAV